MRVFRSLPVRWVCSLARTALVLGCLVVPCLTQAVTAQDKTPGGQPLPGAKQSVPDLEEQVAYQRAFEAVVWAMPASAMQRFRQGVLALPGVEDNVILAYSDTLRTKHKAITANTATPYIAAVTDLRKGPVVLEVPAVSEKASLYGQVVNAWEATIAGVGPVGADKGKGGKYLLIPPGYNEQIPDGYFPIRSSTYRIVLVFRSIPAKGATAADAYAYTKTLKMYPLADAANPKPTKFVDGLPIPVYTLPYYDIRALQDIHDIISVEPVEPRDKVMIGMLATIGIEKGKPFNPSPKMKAAMERGVVDAYHYIQKLTRDLHEKNLWWPDRKWAFVMVPDENRGFEFVNDRAVEVDKRAACWFFYTFYPAVLDEKAGTVYLAPIADTDGKPLEAGSLYRIRVPKDTPAKQFWSITVYDNANWGFIDNPQDRSGLGTFDKDKMKVNDDGSVDIYVGPKAPEGLESNWIPTMDKKPYIWLRLYGPDEPFWKKTWKLPDLVRVK
ncbi:MAG: DUF1254 domain-containing protein [Planctomycetia bacterium]|nr:DUF1254 domain-containing protein [Planctomycetia bacterium]